MAEDQEERTEEATQQRREDFRKRGQVAQTRELGSVLVLLSSALVLWFLGRFFLQQISEIITQSLGSYLVDAAREGDYKPVALFILKKALMVLAPLLGILGVMSVAATVVVVPATEPETFSRVTAEAQAMGTPVVVSDVGGLAEIVAAPPQVSIAERTGWRVPPGDARALAAAVYDVLMLGASAREAMSLRARTQVLGRYSVARMQAETLAAYAELIGR